MRISLRLNQLDSHAYFTLFVNGANAGELVLREREWEDLQLLVELGGQVHDRLYFGNRIELTMNLPAHLDQV